MSTVRLPRVPWFRARVDTTATAAPQSRSLQAVRQRAFAAWVCCLWGALAACLWVRTGAPVESFDRLEAAAMYGSIAATDHGHAHDPARVPQGSPVEASESEEQTPEDAEARDEPRAPALGGPNKRLVAAQRDDDCATPRDASTSQRHNRGPPRA